MTDADAQTVKILIVAKRGDNIPQSIVPPVSATLLKARAARWDVQLIVGNQNVLWLDLEKPSHCRDRSAAAIHESGGYEYAQVMTGQGKSPGQAIKSGFHLQRTPALSCERRNEIGACIMTSAPVFATGVAQSRNEFYTSQCEYCCGKRRSEGISPRCCLQIRCL